MRPSYMKIEKWQSKLGMEVKVVCCFVNVGKVSTVSTHPVTPCVTWLQFWKVCRGDLFFLCDEYVINYLSFLNHMFKKKTLPVFFSKVVRCPLLADLPRCATLNCSWKTMNFLRRGKATRKDKRPMCLNAELSIPFTLNGWLQKVNVLSLHETGS